MRSAISFLSCIAGWLVFTAVATGRPIGNETFDRDANASSWIQTTAVSVHYAGSTDGSRGFASLGSEASRVEGNLATSDQPGGVADFYLEFSFRLKDAARGEFNLQLGDARSNPAAIIHLGYRPATGWAVRQDLRGTATWQPVGGLKTILPNAWYRFRFVGRAWGGANAHYDLLLSEANAAELTVLATNLTVFSRGAGGVPTAGHFAFSRTSKGGSGFDVAEITAGTITPYLGPVVKGVDTKTLTGKVMCGYQGWFGAPGDGRSDDDWRHWTKNRGPLADGNAKVDLWPDVSELDPSQRFPTGFKMANGRPAEVFSSFEKPTVLKHFQWMQDYGLDGVFVQRFANGLKSPAALEHCNTVLANCREGANRYGRTYAVMYDLSGLSAGQIDTVMDDWRMLRREMAITEDPAYLQHRGKPVVAIWGIGFNDHRAYTLAECRRLVEFFKNDPEAGGCTVMLGVPANWRTLDGDAVDDPMLLDIAAKADIISPWTVGRYVDPAGAAWYAEHSLKPDLAWCRERGIDYLPVVFPGFSWHNMNDGPLNQIPRLHGEFLWSQFYQAKRANVSMVYVAMFDEVDEGTAIFKCANTVPTGQESQFLTYEGLPNDFYLKMVGDGTKLIRGEKSLPDKLSFR
jgi:hypothetical protein